MPHYADENVFPTATVSRMNTRSSNSKEPFRVLNDQGKPVDRRNKEKAGMKRSALGELTNRQGSNNSMENSKNQLKKSVPVHKTRVLRKAASASIDVPSEPVLSSPVVDKSKPSPTCISSNLKEMSLSKRKNLHDIDSMDATKQLSVWQYAEDINTHLLEVEKHRMPDPNYMDIQTDINSKMRGILVDWLVDVHAKYCLLPQTLHISIHLIDRFLSKESTIMRQRLQLVGITAMFIASKYEEIYPPEVSEFVRITDNAYDIEDVFEMEEHMLKTLGFRVTNPTSYQFLTRFLKAAKSLTKKVDYFSHYIIDCALQDYSMIKYTPSAIAASAVFIARMQMGETPVWNATLEYHSSYSKASIMPCVKKIMEMIWKFQNGIKSSSKLTAVKRKFSKDKFEAVSLEQLKDVDPESF